MKLLSLNLEVPTQPFNVVLLRRIQHEILAAPKQFDMLSWHAILDEDGEETDFFHSLADLMEALPEGAVNPVSCGTTHCIGGWAQALNSKTHSFEDENSHHAGQRLLDLNYEQAQLLFHEENWPERFRAPVDEDGYRNGPTAQQASDRIDFFIATNGTDEE